MGVWGQWPGVEASCPTAVMSKIAADCAANSVGVRYCNSGSRRFGMSLRHAVDDKKVRVAGPFTVESLSPHQVMNVDENDDLVNRSRSSKVLRQIPSFQ